MAVGNPFNLGSTVTAGVVSAKSRGLGANQVESFIQTDATHSKSAKSAVGTVSYGIFSSENSYL